MGIKDIGLSGLTISSIKKNPVIIPIYFLLGCGVFLAAGASLRTLLKNPEVSIARHSNPEPWNEYANKQYKFFGFGRDYSQSASQAPKY